MTNQTSPPTGPSSDGYLDAASAEPLHAAARATLLAALDQGYADPRRLHGPGRTARLLLDNARAVVAECFAVRPDEVVFTGSGTEAVHRGLLGLLRGRERVSGRLVHSSVEHSAVLQAGAWWRDTAGGTTDPVPVDQRGRILLEALRPALDRPTGVLAVQAANHEVGTRQPLGEVFEAAGDVPVFVHVPAGAGREVLPTGWTAAAASARQWGGPAGVGVLLLRRGARWRSPFPTDDRVDPRTVGFENVPAVLAAAAALQATRAEAAELDARLRGLVDRIRTRVAETVPDVEVVGDPTDRLPHLVTFSCLYVDGEALVTELDRLGFAVASGSACTAASGTPSHVLEAMGVLTHGNVRLSLSRGTTEAEVDQFLEVLPGAVAGIRERAGVL